MAASYEKFGPTGPAYTDRQPGHHQRPQNNGHMGTPANTRGAAAQNSRFNNSQAYNGQNYGQQNPGAGNGYGAVSHPIVLPTGVAYVQLDPPQKSLVEAYLLWLVFGLIGGHHLYLRRPWYGLTYMCTLGLCGFGWLADLFRMTCLVRDANLKLRNPETAHHRSKTDAYILWFPFGLLGFHLFYLRKPGQGVLYFFTLGLFGLGWLVDIFRIPSLVKQCNELPPGHDPDRSVFDAYMFWIPPMGILGGHHFYLQRYGWGLVYFFTLGLCGFGWLVDFCRIPVLTKRANRERWGEADREKRYLDDAYVLWLPFGFLGYHHFYLRRIGWGLIYHFTFGLAFIGWLIDLCRLPSLVRDYNRDLQTRRRLQATVAQRTAAYAIRASYGMPPRLMPVPSAPAYDSSYSASAYLSPPAYEGPTPAGYQDPGYGQSVGNPPTYEESEQSAPR